MLIHVQEMLSVLFCFIFVYFLAHARILWTQFHKIQFFLQAVACFTL